MPTRHRCDYPPGVPAFDLRLLTSFVTLAHELHFGRAAERLNIAQPALSRQMQRLEAQLGVPLFVRSSRTVELTAAAEAFLPHARRSLIAAERAEAAALAAVAGSGGELRLGLDLDIPQSIIRRVRAFGGAHPEVRLRVTVRQQDDALRDLRRGELDAVVGWVSGAGDDALTADRVAGVPFVVALREGDAHAGAGSMTRETLRGSPLVLFERQVAPECFDHLTSLLRDSVPGGLEVVEVPALDTPAEGQLEAVRATGSPTIVSHEYFLRTEPPGLVALDLDPPLVLDVVLFSPRAEASGAVGRLRAHLAGQGVNNSFV